MTSIEAFVLWSKTGIKTHAWVNARRSKRRYYFEATIIKTRYSKYAERHCFIFKFSLIVLWFTCEGKIWYDKKLVNVHLTTADETQLSFRRLELDSRCRCAGHKKGMGPSGKRLLSDKCYLLLRLLNTRIKLSDAETAKTSSVLGSPDFAYCCIECLVLRC